MSKNLEFLFDFGGPNSYLAYKMLPDLCTRTGAKVLYVPILLGGLFKLTNNQAPMMRYAETPAKQKYEMLEFQRFVNAHAIPFKMNPRFPLNTLYVMRGAIAAQRLGCFAPYMDAVMAAMWPPAEKPITPMRWGSSCQRAAPWRITRRARCASADSMARRNLPQISSSQLAPRLVS